MSNSDALFCVCAKIDGRSLCSNSFCLQIYIYINGHLNLSKRDLFYV